MIKWQQQIESVQSASSFESGARLANDAKGLWAVVGSNDSTLIDMFGTGGKADLAGAVFWGESTQIQSNTAWLTGGSPSIGLYRLGTFASGPPQLGGIVDAMLLVWAYGEKLMYVEGVGNINALTPQQYDVGATPAVSLDAYATNPSAIPIVEVHGAINGTQLWYRVGYFNVGPVNASNPFAASHSVTWSDSHPISGKAFGNAYGTAPSVVVAGGYVIVVFEGSKGNHGNLWIDVGKLTGNTIDWLSQENYSTGLNPSVGLTPTYFGQPYQNPSSIVETHTDPTTGNATYRAGTWNNQSSPTGVNWTGGDAVMVNSGCQSSVALDENSAAGFIWLPQCEPLSNLGWGFAFDY